MSDMDAVFYPVLNLKLVFFLDEGVKEKRKGFLIRSRDCRDSHLGPNLFIFAGMFLAGKPFGFSTCWIQIIHYHGSVRTG